MNAATCPYCDGTDTTYAVFSGGREMFCHDCCDNYPIPDDAPDKPRATLLQTETGRIALRAQMDQEIARLKDVSA